MIRIYYLLSSEYVVNTKCVDVVFARSKKKSKCMLLFISYRLKRNMTRKVTIVIINSGFCHAFVWVQRCFFLDLACTQSCYFLLNLN